MEDIKDLALLYYSRKDVQKAIYDFCKNRETISKYKENFGKRPDVLQFPSDVLVQAKKGATSFHCSEEIWIDPLQLTTDMTKEEQDKLREGWDLLIDIDSKHLEYSKIMLKLIIEALSFHNIKNIGIKFSGSKGFHIIVPWKAFPLIINGQETKNLFPDLPRAISSYLYEFIYKELEEKIAKLSTDNPYIKKNEEEIKKVIPDITLVSSRHLFRCPYSLHEKTKLASIVVEKEKIDDFDPKDADPLKVKIKNFYPDARKNEAKELVIQALDWIKTKKTQMKVKKIYEKIEIDKIKLMHPPCIQKILEGLEDGRKRALFILINYFRSLNFSEKEVREKIEEWNKKNKKPLKQNYIDSQLKWNFKHPNVLPPNCDKSYYKDILICNPDLLCKKIKNPVNYALLKFKINKKLKRKR